MPEPSTARRIFLPSKRFSRTPFFKSEQPKSQLLKCFLYILRLHLVVAMILLSLKT